MNSRIQTPTDARSLVCDRDRVYAEVVETYGGALSRLVMGYEADAERRRDLLQDIHIALWTSLATFKGQCSLKTWVYRVGHNVSINHVVKDKRQRGSIQLGLDELSDYPGADDPSVGADASITLHRLHELIQALRPIDRQLILLYLDDLDANAMAEITGLSTPNVATKIHRIKQILARRFLPRGADHD